MKMIMLVMVMMVMHGCDGRVVMWEMMFLTTMTIIIAIMMIMVMVFVMSIIIRL